LLASGGQVRRAEPAPTRGEITQFYEGTNQIQRLVIARPVQRLAATGRAKYVPDAAVTDGVQREATGTPSVTPRRWSRLVIPGQDHSCSVAGRGFEPRKASADGFTVRYHSVGLRQAIDATSRALRVPFMESTGGHSRLTMASRNPSSRLYTAHVELFPSSRSTAGASGGPRLRDGPGLGPRVVGHQLRGYPVASGYRFPSCPAAAAHLTCSRAALAAGSPDCFDLSPEAGAFFSKCFHGAVSLNLADNPSGGARLAGGGKFQRSRRADVGDILVIFYKCHAIAKV
jgi:hypothetical protein